MKITESNYKTFLEIFIFPPNHLRFGVDCFIEDYHNFWELEAMTNGNAVSQYFVDCCHVGDWGIDDWQITDV